MSEMPYKDDFAVAAPEHRNPSRLVMPGMPTRTYSRSISCAAKRSAITASSRAV